MHVVRRYDPGVPIANREWRRTMSHESNDAEEDENMSLIQLK